MRIILTEEQVKKLTLIKEGNDYADRVIEKIKSLKEGLNKMYNVLTFTTLAEIRDRDFDLLNLQKKYNDEIYVKYEDLYKKVGDFEQRSMDSNGDWYSEELERVWIDMDIRLDNIKPMVEGLYKIIEFMISASQEDLHEPFNGITPTEL